MVVRNAKTRAAFYGDDDQKSHGNRFHADVAMLVMGGGQGTKGPRDQGIEGAREQGIGVRVCEFPIDRLIPRWLVPSLACSLSVRFSVHRLQIVDRKLVRDLGSGFDGRIAAAF